MKAVITLICLVFLFQAKPLISQSFFKRIATTEDEVARAAIQTPDGGFLIYYVAGAYTPTDPGRLAYRDIVLKIDAQGNSIDSLVFYDDTNLNFCITQLTKHGSDFLIQGAYYNEYLKQVSYGIMRYSYDLQLIHDTIISKPGCDHLYTGSMIVNQAGHLVLPGSYSMEGQSQAHTFCREMTIDGDSVKEKIFDDIFPGTNIIELTGNHTYNLIDPWSIVQLDTNFNFNQVLYTAPSVGMPDYLYFLFSPKNVDNLTYLIGSRMYESSPYAFDAAWGLFNNGVWDNDLQFGTVDTADFFMGMDFSTTDRIYTAITQLTPLYQNGAYPSDQEFDQINNQMLLYSTNIVGSINWMKRFSGLGFIRSGPPKATTDGGCLWLGYYWDWNHKTNQDYDIIIHKVNPDGTFFENQEEPGLLNQFVHVFPNPGNELKAEINYPGAKLVLFNSLGQKEMQSVLQSGINIINTTHLQPGIYYYQILNQGRITECGKWIKI